MNSAMCSKSDLQDLLCERLNSKESDRVMRHLETCRSCQETLEGISSEESWWQRATVSLREVETDEEYRVVRLETVTCSIDTILDVGSAFVEFSPESILELLDSPSHPETLGRIDEFEIEKKIGQGGMGVVFRGFDRSLNRPVAIKLLAPHLGSNDVARQRFEREARAAAAVVHPSVVPIYRVSTEDKNRPYIAMALADGLSLQQHVSKYGPFEVKDVVRIGIQITSGLAEAHKQGLVHRDIKPANVLMEKEVSRILITDFGLARAADDVMMTQSGCLAGTPSYMSPEQVRGIELDHRSDLFSLGGLLYFISTGREPFQAESAFGVINKVIRDAPKSPRTVNVDIPEVLNRIIERLLEKDPKDRIESAERLEQLLTQVLASMQEPTQHIPPKVKATKRERYRKRSVIGVGLATIVLTLALAAWFNYSGGFRARSKHQYEHSNSASNEYGDHSEHRGSNDREEHSKSEEEAGGSNQDH